MATSLNQPQAISQPFAQNGDKNVIPVTNDGTTGEASQSLGFPPVTSEPVAQGGIPPARKDFNGIFNVLSNQYFYLQNGGSFTFNQDVSDAIGGYPVNAILRYTDNDVSYQVRSLIPNNTYNFVTTPSYIDGVHWEKAFSEDLSNYVSKTGSNTISANNTFSGTNTFSGSTSLSTNTTGVTQATNDASTKIATTQFVQNVAVTKANKDMDNLTSTGQNIANWSTNVTNCITEIPQDIKLELNNGTLTLKAGSKVYVPNGPGVFNAVTINSDITIQGLDNTQYINLYYPQGGYISKTSKSNVVSGPDGSSVGEYGFWYDTTNNIIKRKLGGVFDAGGYSLPFGLSTANSSGIQSIDQVFNGFGYIGSTVFALPGVKGLIPNGRNADGTLKNTEFTIPQVQTFTHTSGTTDRVHYFCYPTGGNITIHDKFLTGDKPTSGNRVWFDTVNNVVYFCADWASASSVKYKLQTLMFGWSKLNNSVISDLETKTAFHAVDYNDFSDLKDTVDTNVVKLTGNQSIAGAKTLLNTLYFKEGGTYSDTPASNQRYGQIRFQDSTGKYTGVIDSYTDTTGTTHIRLYALLPTDTSKYSIIDLSVDKNGNWNTSIPTPATSDNSTKIATTAYVNNKHQLVSALPASPNADVFYYIPEN